MPNKNLIGLDADKTANLADKLNQLLADLQICGINARGFHRNIRDERFTGLHDKLAELYRDTKVKSDEVAERILILGCRPLQSLSDCIAAATIREAEEIAGADAAIDYLLEGFQHILAKERALHRLAGDACDVGTAALMSDYIRQHEKAVWIYSAYLSRQPFR